MRKEISIHQIEIMLALARGERLNRFKTGDNPATDINMITLVGKKTRHGIKNTTIDKLVKKGYLKEGMKDTQYSNDIFITKTGFNFLKINGLI